MGLRQDKQIATRERIVSVARGLFQSMPYDQVTIRLIASGVGMTTGAIYANYPNKSEIWWAAMGSPPPIDSPILRNTSAMEAALARLVGYSKDKTTSSKAWRQAWKLAESALAERRARATGPDESSLNSQPGSGSAFPDAATAFPSALLEDLRLIAARRAPERLAHRQLKLRLKALSDALGLHGSGNFAGSEVYRIALEAAAEVLIAASEGVTDEPYRFDGAYRAQLRSD